MVSSSTSGIRDLLGGFVAGRVPADRIVPAVAAAFYRGDDRREQEALRPVMDVIERAAPGIVQLARAEGGPGFDIRLAERPFPVAYEAELRRAAVGALAGVWAGAAPAEDRTPSLGFWGRLVGRVRRLFSASS
jgi:hypothetical protein